MRHAWVQNRWHLERASLLRDTKTIFLEQVESAGSVAKNHGRAVYLYVNDVVVLTEELQSRALEVARVPESALYPC